jgi:hypothetical protein
MNPYLFDPMQRHRLAPTGRTQAITFPTLSLRGGSGWLIPLGRGVRAGLRRVYAFISVHAGLRPQTRALPRPVERPTCCASTCCA